MQAIVSLCKRRGIIFQSSEIYGGLNGCWDYGPLGVELKRNVKENWWRDNVILRDDIVGVDCSILMNPRVWEASGHVSSFTDPMVDCMQCKGRFRADHIVNNQCPTCGSKDKFTEVRHFNLMFKTHVGALEDSSSIAYLRPETCQGIFANFDNVVNTSRVKVPFGIAQIGKAFRNEINPRNFTFRSREFEQMEMEFFTPPEEAPKWFEYWKKERYEWYLRYGIKRERLHLREHEKTELAHYAAGCADVEYDFPFGCSELEGIANRTDYDLKQHSAFSKKDLSYFDQPTNKRFIPYVIEPSAGADRATLAFLVDAYEEEAERTVLRFHPKIAPIKAAILPLVNKDGMPEMAEKIQSALKRHWNVFFDDKGAIGRRYRRQDEAGTPFCVTVDGESAKDNSVTVRHRDAMNQERVGIDHLVTFLTKAIQGA
ncbi:MAG: glycine--tRNA ligase [Deltaproteobacteria bacterium]|nr:glycine--tRNA ligase [Deltaproteobacteria bacterium]MBI3294738.1 glycine--tRNA ligase [Deltaproteobacteria bacterium]